MSHNIIRIKLQIARNFCTYLTSCIIWARFPLGTLVPSVPGDKTLQMSPLSACRQLQRESNTSLLNVQPTILMFPSVRRPNTQMQIHKYIYTQIQFGSNYQIDLTLELWRRTLSSPCPTLSLWTKFIPSYLSIFNFTQINRGGNMMMTRKVVFWRPSSSRLNIPPLKKMGD